MITGGGMYEIENAINSLYLKIFSKTPAQTRPRRHLTTHGFSRSHGDAGTSGAVWNFLPIRRVSPDSGLFGRRTGVRHEP
jgi:hypothetical protein